MRTKVAEQLGFSLRAAEKIPVSLKMLNKTTILTDTALIRIRLQNQDGGPAQWFRFFTLNQICTDRLQPEVDPRSKEQLEKLNIRLSDDHDVQRPIDMLIGTDQLVGLQTHNTHRLEETLEVVETAFGWALFGCRTCCPKQDLVVNHAGLTCLQCSVPQMDPIGPTNSLDQRFRRFVEAEALAIEKEPRDEDQQFEKDFMEKVTFDPESKRFIVDLPFKEGLRPGLNLTLAKARLKALEKSLDRLNIRERYRAEIQALIESKFVEQVQENQATNDIVSYLPHKQVIKEDSLTTKLRIVFDASAKERGSLSLNEALHTGPNLTEDLLAVLIRFRMQRVVLLADIEKSFPQIVIREEHRDALRFLWNNDASGKPQTFRLTRNYFGFASSSFVLAACVRTLLQ